MAMIHEEIGRAVGLPRPLGGILVIPDFIANAGGVICCTVEYHGGSEETAFSVIKEKNRKNTEGLLKRLVRDRLPPREAAMRLALDRLRDATSYRDSAFLWKKVKHVSHPDDRQRRGLGLN